MGVISVRIPDPLLKELADAGIKVGEVVRADLLELARRLQVDRKMATLAKYRGKASKPVADTVRKARDEH